MKENSPLGSAIDVLYGRVSPYVPEHKPRKMKNATFIVSFWLPYWKPNYAYADTWLSYEVGTAYYKIFNPQKFKLRTDELIIFLCQWHRYVGEVAPVNFKIIGS